MSRKQMLLESLRLKIRSKRDEWRGIRSLRLTKKVELLKKGLPITEIRKDKSYRVFYKQQKRLTKELRHLEKKFIRFFH